MKLFLCEKPSQGRDIARVLGATKKGDGCLTGAGIIVTWAFGHLMEMAQPEYYDVKYKKWTLTDLPVIPPKWQLRVKPEGKKQFTTIRRLLKNASEVVIATDADREGEMIAREILEECQFRGPVLRLWLSALDDASIRKGLNTIRPGESTEPLYQSGLGRARADWLTGMNLTRLFTLKGRRLGEKGVYSVGRVQTPTLRLIVDRDREISHFIPRDYWTLKVKLTAADGNSSTQFQADWLAPESFCDEAGRCIRDGAAQQAVSEIRQVAKARVDNTETKRVKTPAPLPFDLGTLQQSCSEKWGMGAQQVLDIAQSLYETHKVTTYPRTDSGYLPLSQLADAPQVLKAVLMSQPAFSTVLVACDTGQKSRAWNDSKMTAHHGIIPTAKPAEYGKMSADERRVYELICCHYIAQFLAIHETDNTVINLSCDNHRLVARGQVVVVPGWKQVFGNADQPDTEACTLPRMAEGALCQVNDTLVTLRKTRPPEHYTEGTLIAAMKNSAKFVSDEKLKQRLRESAGLGTEATRGGIIETLLARGYIRKQKRHLVATDSARTLMAMLPEIVKDPGMTALWEQALDEIAAGKLPLAVFLQKQSMWISALVSQTAERGR